MCQWWKDTKRCGTFTYLGAFDPCHCASCHHGCSYSAEGRGVGYPGCGTVTSFNSSFCLLSPLSNLTCLSCSFLAPVRWAEIGMKKKSRGWKLLSGQEVDESLARWSLLRKRSVLNKVGDRKLLAPVLSYPRPPCWLAAFSGLIFCS